MGCCDNIIKCALFVLNILCMLVGVTIIAVGAVLYDKYSDFNDILSSPIASPPIILLVIGAITFLVAILGCTGALCGSSCMLITYAILLLLIFIAQIGIGVFIIVNGKDTLSVFEDVLRKEFNQVSTDSASFDLIKALQTNLKCCGVTGPSDYNGPTSTLFQSCCSDSTKFCLVAEYRDGCAKVLSEFVEDNAVIMGGIGIGIAFVELLASISGFALASYEKQRM